MLPDGLDVNPGRNSVHRQSHALFQESPGGEQNHHGDHQPDQRVDDVPAGPENQNSGQNHPHRDQRVGQHVQIGAFHIQIMLLFPLEEEHGQPVDDHPDAGRDDDRPAADLLRREKLPDALRHNCANGDQKNRRIQQRRPDRPFSKPVGVVREITFFRKEKCSQRDQ